MSSLIKKIGFVFFLILYANSLFAQNNNWEEDTLLVGVKIAPRFISPKFDNYIDLKVFSRFKSEGAPQYFVVNDGGVLYDNISYKSNNWVLCCVGW